MIVNPANAANIYAVTREQVQVEKSGPPERSPDSGGGQTGNAGPAVVANLSAAALETSRAVRATDRAADQNRAGRVGDEDPAGNSKKPRSSVDVIV